MNYFLYILFAAYLGLAAPDTCSAELGDCLLRATYNGGNYTYWAAVCDDGKVLEGVIGGDVVPGICGA